MSEPEEEEIDNANEFVEMNKEELEDLTDKILNMFEVLEFECDSMLCKMTHKDICETTEAVVVESR